MKRNMQLEKAKWIIVLLFALAINEIGAQNILNIYDNSKNKTSFTLGQIQKLTISGGNLTINNKDATSSTYALTNLAYLNFTSITTDIIENQSEIMFSLYPNPVQNSLNIRDSNISAKFAKKLEIIEIDGKVAYSTVLNTKTLIFQLCFLVKESISAV